MARLRPRRRPSAALVVALLALFVAVGGPAEAARLIGSKDVKNRSLKTEDLSKKAVRTLRATPPDSIGAPRATRTAAAMVHTPAAVARDLVVIRVVSASPDPGRSPRLRRTAIRASASSSASGGGPPRSACAVAFGAAHRSTSRRAGELSNFLDMSDDLLTEPLEISGGELAVRPGPGIGIEIDPDKLAHYRRDR